MGKYVHFLTVRVTESYPLFQTDGELNKARVRAGIQNHIPISRLTMFKRKQSTPERLVGRELLRNYGLITAEEWEYNVKFAMDNPDCIIYGFAIGDSGSEKSKVVVDTAFSITAFDESHETFTLNAPFENGTMASKGEAGSKLGEVPAELISKTTSSPRSFSLALSHWKTLPRRVSYTSLTTSSEHGTMVLKSLVQVESEIS